MTSFSIDVLPNPAPDNDALLEYSARLRALRLRSLKEDTKSFISKYESEVNEPEHFWLNRLRFDRVIHLVLGCHSLASPNPDLLQKEWVGFVVIIAPSHEEVNSKIQLASAGWEMAALYVKPEVRGQGQGRRLVEATIDFVKEHGFTDENQTPFCLTSVRHGNDNALELYQRLGFRIIDPNEHVEKEGSEYLATSLRIDFQRGQ